jgi:hypothetical protein
VTGHTETTYIDKAIISGMNQVLSKPVQNEVLKSIIIWLKYDIDSEIDSMKSKNGDQEEIYDEMEDDLNSMYGNIKIKSKPFIL